MKKTKKPVMGRPALPEKVRRTVHRAARFTPYEAAHMDKLAKREGLNGSDWMRAVLLGAK
jgi:hypothetical protein